MSQADNFIMPSLNFLENLLIPLSLLLPAPNSHPIMTRLLTRCFFLSTTIFLFSVASCDKDKTTTVNGTVVDKVTGMPLKDASITFSVYYKDNPSPNDYDFPSVSSDQLGQFNFSSSEPLHIHEISKGGYLFKGQGPGISAIKLGEINEVKIEMVPKDGMLKLNINNSSGVLDTIYIGICSPLQEAEFYPSYGVFFRESFIVENLNYFDKILSLASEETITVYWGFSPLQFDIKTAPFHDSVYVTRNDTTMFNISF